MATTVTPHATDDFWNKDENIDGYLARKLKNGSTSLFLGAGASHGFNLPNWSGLVEGVRSHCGAAPPAKSVRAEDEADTLLHKTFVGDRMRFALAVREALYAPAKNDSKFLLKSDLLQAVTAFLTNSQRGRGGAVVSFNFDDIVETYLRLLGFVVRSETSVPAWNSNADMHVYHPHGLLPMAQASGSTKIVFTTSDFDEVVGRESDAWNQTMSSILSTTFPVFIGLSGEDSRLRSLLTTVKTLHPATVKDASIYWGVRPTPRGEDDMVVQKWKRMGVVPRYIASHAELPAWLLGICQRAASEK